MPAKNVSYNQFYRAFSAKNKFEPQMSSDIKKHHQPSKSHAGPMIHIDDPNSQNNLLTPQMLKEKER